MSQNVASKGSDTRQGEGERGLMQVGVLAKASGRSYEPAAGILKTFQACSWAGLPRPVRGPREGVRPKWDVVFEFRAGPASMPRTNHLPMSNLPGWDHTKQT